MASGGRYGLAQSVFQVGGNTGTALGPLTAAAVVAWWGQNGVALYFVVEFELVRPRWYWFDERAVASRLQYRLTYHPLSRQYRLWTGNLHQPFISLAEALRVLGRVRSWVVLDRDQVSPDKTYEAAVRMRLDTTQLPKPFQVSAITNREWTLTSDWKRFVFVPSLAPVVTRSVEGAK